MSERLAYPDRGLHAPHPLTVEVAQVVRRHVHTDRSPRHGAPLPLADLADLDRTGHDCVPFLPRIWELRENASAYDAAWLALAEVLEARLVTFDASLARSPGHRASVDLVGGPATPVAAG